MFRLGAIAFVSVSLLALVVPPSPAAPVDISTVSTAPRPSSTSPSAVDAAATADSSTVMVNMGVCGNWEDGWAGYGSWAVDVSGCALFGTNGTTVGYSWQIPAGNNGRICVEGMGLALKNGARYEKWYSLGCGNHGSAGGFPWGASAANPKVRAKVQLAFPGGPYSWIH